MITNKGKTLISKYMLGQTPSFTSFIAIGCGPKPTRPSNQPYIELSSSSITGYKIEGNLATVNVTSGSITGLLNGSTVNIAFGDSRYDGNYAVSNVSATGFTYTAPVTIPGITALSWATSLATYTTGTTAHGLRAGDRITTSALAPTGYNNTDYIYSVPSTVTFTMYEATNPGTITDQIGTIALLNPPTIPVTATIKTVTSYTDNRTKQDLDFEMTRIPITFRGIDLDANNNEVLIFGGEIDSQQRFDITEIGLFSSAKNNIVVGQDSTILYNFSENENWEIHSGTVSAVTPFTESLGSSGTINIGTNVASYVLASSSNFNNPTRLSNYERPRVLDSTLLVRGSLSSSSISGPGTYTNTNNHIHITGQQFNFTKNSSNDEIRLAFSVVSQDPAAANPTSANIVLEFSAADDTSATTQRAYYIINKNNFTNGRYFVEKIKLSQFSPSSGFSWSTVTTLKIFANIIESGSPSGNYYIAFDGLRFENISDSELNPSYGMIAYSNLGTTDSPSLPISKSENTSTLIEYSLPLEIL